MVSSPNRPQRDSCLPVPHSRSEEASPGPVFCIRALDARRIFGQTGEERSGDPAGEELFELALIARRSIELTRKKLVRSNPRGAFVVVVYPGGRTDEHDAAHHIGPRKSGVQQHPAPEGVPDVVGRAATPANELRCLPEVGAEVGGSPVPRKVHGIHPVRRRENLFEPSPGGCVLSEAVQEPDRCTLADSLHVELTYANLTYSLWAGRTAVCHDR